MKTRPPTTDGHPSGLDATSVWGPVDDTPPAWRRYGVAIVSVALAWALTRVAPPLHQVPSTLFFAAVTITAFYGHLGPGLLATGLSTLAMDYSFMAPVKDLASGLGEFVRVGAFALASALINSLHEQRRRAEAERQKSEAHERGVLEASARELEVAHETVARALAHRENIMESIPDILYTLDLDGNLTGWNRRLELISGFPPEELKGKPALALFLGEDEAVVVEGFRDAFEKGYAEREVRLLQKDGSAAPYQFTAVPLKDGQGKVIGLTGVGRDLSERKRLEEDLRQAQKMEAIGQLAGGVAHDFGNLLTVIQGRSQLVLHRLEPDSEVRRDLALINTTATHAGNLIHQLLAFSRRQTLQARVLDLNAVVSNMEQILRRLIGEDITLLTSLGPDLTSLRADRRQLGQVVMNLVINARDATSGGGQIRIETTTVTLDAVAAMRHPGLKAGSYVVLSVIDNGSGMTDETRSRLFEPFFTTKPRGQGTGLGLATVYGIVIQSGGTIEVESEPGRGATFRVYLPSEAGAVHAVDRPVETQRAGGTASVLLVEDEQPVRELVRMILERAGFTVTEASNPDEAEAMVATMTSIDLLLTDVVMPGRTGFDLFRTLVATTPSLRVLFISGYTDYAMFDPAISEHGAAFLEKPFSAEALVAKVRDVLNQ